MLQFDENYLLLVIGILAIILEILLGVATGFDLFIIGLILILSGVFGKFINSFPTALISIITLSFIYVLFARKFIKSKLAIETKATNVDGLIGKKATVVKKIEPEHPGQIKIEGEIWRAQSDKTVDINNEVVIRSVSGVTLKVE